MNDTGTTEFIRRRIRHWRTTLAGVAAIVLPIVGVLWPEWAPKLLLLSSALSGAGLLAAADGSNVQDNTVIKKP